MDATSPMIQVVLFDGDGDGDGAGAGDGDDNDLLDDVYDGNSDGGQT